MKTKDQVQSEIETLLSVSEDLLSQAMKSSRLDTTLAIKDKIKANEAKIESLLWVLKGFDKAS